MSVVQNENTTNLQGPECVSIEKTHLFTQEPCPDTQSDTVE